MSSEYGKKSAAEMRAAQREKISQAETATPAVVVTEKNRIALSEIEDFVKQKFPGSRLTFYEDRDRSGRTFAQ